MRALTVMQPWAWGLVKGHKRVENRTWRTEYRGLLAIHAGLGRDWLRELERGWGPMWRDREPFAGLGVPLEGDMRFGEVVGVVELVDCVRVNEVERRGGDPWATGPWCWVVEPRWEVRPGVAVVTGQRSLWTLPDGVGELVEAERAVSA